MYDTTQMEKSVLADMLKKLNDDKRRLLAELDELERAIRSLAILKGGISVDKLTNERLANNADGKPVRKNYYESVDVVIPSSFSLEMTTIDLFFYVLNDIVVPATVEEITERALTLDNSKEVKFLLGRFRDIASGLYRAKKIFADTRKRKFKYSLKEIAEKEIGFEEKMQRDIDAIFNK